MFWRHTCWFIVSIASLYCSVANGQWDESSLTTIYSDGVFLDVIPRTDNRLEFLPVVVDPTQAYGEYAQAEAAAAHVRWLERVALKHKIPPYDGPIPPSTPNH